MVTDPFLAPIEEELALIGVEFSGNICRPTEIVPELVVMKRSCELSCRIRIARPGVRIQRIVLKVFISRAVELLRATLGNDADLGAGGSSVFRCVVRSKNLYFLGRIYVCRTDAGAIGARPRGRRAVKGNQVLGISRAVEIRWSLTKKWI